MQFSNQIWFELYDKFAELGEGPLTKARAQLVNRRALAGHARRLELGQHLILSRGEELHGGRERISALADAFEAVVGAILLDSGFESARAFVLREFAGSFGDVPVVPKLHNPKGELQEFIQSFSAVPPRYRIVSVTGPDHDREFECTVEHDGKELASGRGKSKKTAESAAAVAALEYIKKRRRPSPVAAKRRKPKSTRKGKPKREDAA